MLKFASPWYFYPLIALVTIDHFTIQLIPLSNTKTKLILISGLLMYLIDLIKIFRQL